MKAFKAAIVVAVLICVSVVSADENFSRLRALMVKHDIKGRGITSPAVIQAMGNIPRHRFVNRFYRGRAYGDFPLPIGEGQTISQPYVVALMTELLGLRPHDKVLEIGTGSGYQAAVLAQIVKEVYTIEIRSGLAEQTRRTIKDLGYENINLKIADGYYGWEEHAPFDAIMITAFANHIPPPLIEQLRPGGRLILPLGNTTFHQTLTLATKEADGNVKLTLLGSVRFVPMTGKVRSR